MRLSLSLFTALIAVAGCASTADTEPKPKGVAKYADDPRLGEEVDRICFASNIDSFGDNTRDTFTVREGRDYYLIEIFGSCPPLQHAMTMRMDSTMNCLTAGDHVIVSDSLTSSSSTPFSKSRCLVKSIYKWDPKAGEAEDTSETKSDEQADEQAQGES
ncbi:DUF6491 family protein [Hyphomonas jannaschiana]|uniref:Lipoprotein n=1 Tax=Hyphomonas jannaschiana VP2 TaxID=1280952 RepID=A0A059FAM9_9PROT|nr:DUF6491 family protein [Hyphomonas jannaschiana]KCZ87674.1 hypothetical protein HJA_11759 [Hyphomonas jannaschiana VP2]